MPTKHSICGLTILVTGLLFSSCMAKTIRSAPRTPTEQLLTSRAIEKAIASIDFGGRLEGRFIKINAPVTLENQEDINYLAGTFTARCLESGAIVAGTSDNVDIVINLFVSGVGSESRDTDIGVPLQFPGITGVGGISKPLIDINLARIRRHVAMARLWGYATDTEGTPLFGIQPVYQERIAGVFSILQFEVFSWGNLDKTPQSVPLTEQDELIPPIKE